MKFEKIRYVDRNTGNVMVESVPGEKMLKFLYYNPLGKLPLELIVKRKFLSSIYGMIMNSRWSCKKIHPFVSKYKINMDESVKKTEDFKSFNDFFIRELKEKAREVAIEENIVTAPSDGKILAYEDINLKDKFFLKGDEFTLGKFLKDDKLAQKYQGGTFIIVRLAPVDYHRFHFPANGHVGESQKIDGSYYSVSPYAIRKNFRIYCENKREYSLLETEKFGGILLSEIGATMVGGIKQSYQPGSKVKKGEEKGYFYFGGSSCIMLFEKGRVKIDNDVIENTKRGMETKIYMGEKIGVSI